MKKSYSREFKVEVCEAVMTEALQHNEAAEKYGISHIMLYRWISEYKEKGAYAFCGKGSLLAINAKLTQLQRDNDELVNQNRELTLKLEKSEKQKAELLLQMQEFFKAFQST